MSRRSQRKNVQKAGKKKQEKKKKTEKKKTEKKPPAAVVNEKVRTPPLHTITSILMSKHDEAAPIEEQLKFMKARHETLAEQLGTWIEDDHFMKVAADWADTTPGYWSDTWDDIHSYARSFAYHYCCKDSTKETLTKKQKKQVIARLDGYCVKRDFDDLVSRLNLYHQKSIFERFTSTYLMKVVVEKLFQHPFWYAEAEQSNEQEEKDATFQNITSDGAVLERFLARFEEIDPIYARIWRNIGIRFCNSMYSTAGENPSFAQALKDRRWRKCHLLAKQLLADEIFKCLLEPTSNPTEREKTLGNHLGHMSDRIMGMLSQNPTIKFRTLNQLEPQFCYGQNYTETDLQHGFDRDEVNTRLDGREVLMIQCPSVVYHLVDESGENPEEHPICKASAIIEDPGFRGLDWDGEKGNETE
ncbi:hypothetical protein BJX70DRAFT_401129 [Aspergillus crustosus]